MANATRTRTAPKSNPVVDEVNGTLVPVPFHGNTYLVPPTTMWPIVALAEYENGRLVAFLKAILGPDQHKTLLASDATVGDLGEFVKSIQGALGIEGN
jgi:hypothetical protein